MTDPHVDVDKNGFTTLQPMEGEWFIRCLCEGDLKYHVYRLGSRQGKDGAGGIEVGGDFGEAGNKVTATWAFICEPCVAAAKGDRALAVAGPPGAGRGAMQWVGNVPMVRAHPEFPACRKDTQGQ